MDTDHSRILIRFYEDQRRMPTYSEMMRLFGFKSKNAVARLVEKLMDAGIVGKDALGRLVPTDRLTDTPMLGLVKAGFPSPTEEVSFDTLNIDSFLIQKKESTYLLKVDGDSMIDAHIADGDLVVAERTETARDGQIVIAEVDGEFTMKYYRSKGGKVWLDPANSDFKPIFPKDSLFIRAVVKGVIRKY